MSGGYSTEGTSTELQELFEERLRRPMGSPTGNRYGNGADGLLPRDKRLPLRNRRRDHRSRRYAERVPM